MEYNLRPDWMKPGFAEKAKAINDAYLEEIKAKQEKEQVDIESDEYIEEDDDYFYKQLFYNSLKNKIKYIDSNEEYYNNLYYMIQKLDAELHPWNYY